MWNVFFSFKILWCEYVFHFIRIQFSAFHEQTVEWKVKLEFRTVHGLKVISEPGRTASFCFVVFFIYFCLLTSLKPWCFLPCFFLPFIKWQVYPSSCSKTNSNKKKHLKQKLLCFFDFPLLHEVSWKRCRDLLSVIILNWLYLVYNLVNIGNTLNKHL